MHLMVLNRKQLIVKFIALLVSLYIGISAPVWADVSPMPRVIPDQNPLQILGPAGEQFRFIKTGKTTCGKYAMAEAIIPAGTGPMPHIHIKTDEWFYTPDGGITLEVGESRYKSIREIPGKSAPKDILRLQQTESGDIHYGPRGFMHGFMNQTSQVKRITFVWAPDLGVTDYFRAVGQPLPDYDNPPPINPRNKELFVSQAPKYGINQSSSFFQYVENVMPANYAFPQEKHMQELMTLLTDQRCSRK
jgi:hypothetical protein